MQKKSLIKNRTATKKALIARGNKPTNPTNSHTDVAFISGDGAAVPLDGGASPLDGGASPLDGGATPLDGGASPLDGGMVTK